LPVSVVIEPKPKVLWRVAVLVHKILITRVAILQLETVYAASLCIDKC